MYSIKSLNHSPFHFINIFTPLLFHLIFLVPPPLMTYYQRSQKDMDPLFLVSLHTQHSVCLAADRAYRLCAHSWSSSHFSPSVSFIPPSSPAALVYSNQGLVEKRQKAFHSQIWDLLSFGCRTPSPSADSSTTKQQQSECTAMAGRITFHCWLVAASIPKEPSVNQFLFPSMAKWVKRDQTKRRRSLWAPLKSVSLFASFSLSTGTPALDASCLFFHSSSFSVPVSKWLQHCRVEGDILTLLIFPLLSLITVWISLFLCESFQRVDEVLIYRTLIYVTQIKYASQVTQAPSYC